jgi:hypothetical protein
MIFFLLKINVKMKRKWSINYREDKTGKKNIKRGTRV